MSQQSSNVWLELSEAADYLGVHFTTLRRWADAGQAPCIRTPGGRRRFHQAELAAFLDSLRSGPERDDLSWSDSQAMTASSQTGHPSVRPGMADQPWYDRLDDTQRSAMRSEGQRLMAVLMQYATRNNGGEIFLEEGRRLAAHYGQACHEASLSLVETAHAFVQARRSIMDSVYQAGALAGAPDADTWRLYDRMNNFLDSMLLATLEAYDQAELRQLEAENQRIGGSADQRISPKSSAIGH